MKTSPPPDIVYRLISAGEWAAAQREGYVRYGAHDEADGFLHLATGAQVLATASRYFSGRTDMLALEIDTETLGAPLKMEESTGGALYPHYYGALSTDAVLAARALGWRQDHFLFADGRAAL